MKSADDLVEVERRLSMEFPYGTHIDLRTGDPQQDDPAQAASWGPQRCIRAEVIRDLLVGRLSIERSEEDNQGRGTSPSVFLSGARIIGRLDLRGIDFRHPLLLQDCAFDEPLMIADSMSRSMRFYGCHLPGVHGAWLKCAGDLHLRDCRIDGEVDLRGAGVSGQLVLSSSTLANRGGVALRADGLVVEGDMFCRDGAQIDGEVSLVAARIGGELRLTASTLRNPGKVALNAARAVVEKDMYCREGFAAEGEVRLSSGQIKGQLNFTNATLSCPGGIALRADHLVVSDHLYCQDNFRTDGEITLEAARVGGEVRFSAARLSNPGATALRADRLNVVDDMYCRQGLEVDGLISLRGAQVKGQLNFNRATLRNQGAVALDAEQVVVGNHLYCQDGFTAHGEISLVAARIGGEVRFSASSLRNPGGVALRADRLVVGSDMYCREGLVVEGTVRIRNATISGQLNFNNAAMSQPDGMCLDAAHLVVGGHLYCQDDFTCAGGIDLVAARVGGEVRFSGATLSNATGIALCADRLVVEKDMYCRKGLVIEGEVALRGASVQGNLSFSTTTIRNPGGTAVQADQLTVGGDLWCDEDFSATGLVDLTDVHVGGELTLSDATLSNPGKVVLHAPRLIVDKDMYCRDGFTADGTICLIGAHVGGKLSFTSARLTGARLSEQQLASSGITKLLAAGARMNPPSSGGTASAEEPRKGALGSMFRGVRRRGSGATADGRAQDELVNGAGGLALLADGLRVDLDMSCDAGFHSSGEIRLKGARVGQNLDFSDAEVGNDAVADGAIANALNAEDMQADRMLMPAVCRAGRISLRNGKMIELDDKRGVRPDQIDIRGLSYETLIPPLDPETRLEWLAKNDYEPQPYDQLARSYRQLGYEASARTVQLEQERRQRAHLPAFSKGWGYLQDVTIGYGYRPDRAAALFLLVVLAGVTWFSLHQPQPLDPGLNPPQFNPVFYTLDVLVPFADFGQRELWNSQVSDEIVKVFLAIFGWTLAITALAGINRKLTRS